MADPWTPSLVEARLAESADVLKRLPTDTVQGYFSTWPKAAYEFADLVGQTPAPMKRPWPTPAAIDRMTETLGWFFGLDPIDARILWFRAGGERWKTICWRVGLSRSAANERWLYALCLLSWKLNDRRPPKTTTRRQLISRTRAARF